MKNLLLDSYPLLIAPELAVAVGLNEAIVLQQIHYWTEINRKANKNQRDGYYWTYNTYEEWQKQFPFWSIMTIRRILKQVKDKHLIETGNYNKLKIDRTKWYRIDYERLKTLSPFGKSYRMQEVNITQPIPESNITETKSNITIDQNSDEFVVERISPNNNIFSRLTDTYGADDVKSVLGVVNQYIDEIYKSKTGREHDKISKAHRMTFVEKLLDFKNDTDTGQEDLIRLLNYMIENINVKDPTIYWLTSPTVLGYWHLTFFNGGYDDLRDTKYMPVGEYY